MLNGIYSLSDPKPIFTHMQCGFNSIFPRKMVTVNARNLFLLYIIVL